MPLLNNGFVKLSYAKPPSALHKAGAHPTRQKSLSGVCIIQGRASLRVPCAFVCVFFRAHSGSAPECSHLEDIKPALLLFIYAVVGRPVFNFTHPLYVTLTVESGGEIDARLELGWSGVNIQNLVTSSHNCFVRRGRSVTHVIFQCQPLRNSREEPWSRAQHFRKERVKKAKSLQLEPFSSPW